MSIIDNIKSKRWDNRVQRPGFLLPKDIVSQAEVQPFHLVNNIFVQYENVCWIESSNLYDEAKTETFVGKFNQAFTHDVAWTEDLLNRLDVISTKTKSYIATLKNTTVLTYDECINYFETYVDLLLQIQHFYVIAVPLTNYCEEILNSQHIDYLSYAVPYKKLDIDALNDSLAEIQKSDNKDIAIQDHIDTYAWIKTNYNIINEYTKKDVLESLGSIHHTGDANITDNNPYITGLRIGIYIRNRIKELSQQLWFYIDPVIIALAKEMSISREDFLQHSINEIRKSFAIRESVLSNYEISKRNNGFGVGILENEEFILTGIEVSNLYDYYNSVDISERKEVKGRVACKGLVKGTVRVINGFESFDKLSKGDILVTSMTTPDYVVIMKKASAIVTDEGGLSCHAAIVSRELGVPCVIGTKNATKILKNGDVVEVDATNGIVRIL